MARAIIRSVQDSIEGEALRLNLIVTYFGPDVPGGSDTSLCSAVILPTMTEAAAADTVRNSIIAEASRLGVTVAANAITSVPKIIARV